MSRQEQLAQVQAARKAASLWLDLEEIERLVCFREADLCLGSTVFFSLDHWRSALGKTSPSEESLQRAFERWKVEVRDLPFEFSAPEAEGLPSGFYGIPRGAPSQHVDASADHAARLVQAYAQMHGKVPGRRAGRKPQDSEPAQSFGPRDLSGNKLSKAFGVACTTITKWVRQGLPHDVAGGKQKPQRKFNLEESEAWVLGAVRAGLIRDPRRPMISKEEAADRVRSVIDDLNLSIGKAAEMASVPDGTLAVLYHGKTKGNRVSLELVQSIEALRDVLPRPLTAAEKQRKHRSLPPIEVMRRALKKAGGQAAQAARELGMDPSTLTQAATRLGIPYQKKPAPISSIVSRQDLVDAMEGSGHRIAGASRTLGVSTSTVNRLIKHYGLTDEFEIRHSGTPRGGKFSRAEIVEAMDAFGPRIQDVAQGLGVGAGMISHLYSEYGLGPVARAQRAETERAAAATRLESALKKGIRNKWTVGRVAQELGVSPTHAHRMIKDLGMQGLRRRLKKSRSAKNPEGDPTPHLPARRPERLLPAPVSSPAPYSMARPPIGSSLSDYTSGNAPLIFVPEGAREWPEVTQAMADLGGYSGPMPNALSPQAWETLLSVTGSGETSAIANVYLVDEFGRQLLVMKMLPDPGHFTGRLKVVPMDERARTTPYMLIDLRQLPGNAIPVVVYKSHWRHGPPPGVTPQIQGNPCRRLGCRR